MKPPSNVKTPAQYVASLPADRAKTIATVRALVNKHIPRGYDECLVWGTIGWTIPLSRYPDTYNKQPICYVALSSHSFPDSVRRFNIARAARQSNAAAFLMNVYDLKPKRSEPLMSSCSTECSTT